MGIDGGVVQQVALRIERHDFAARAESGVDGDDALLSERRREQQLPQVFGEYPDRFVVGLLLGRRQQFGLDRGPDQPLERVRDGSFHPFARRRAVAHELAAKPFRNAVGVHLHRDLQDPFVHAAPHGQKTVRRNGTQRRRRIEVVRIFDALLLLAFHEPGVNCAFAGRRAAHAVAGALVLRHPLGDDVARPGYSLLRGRHVGRDETLRLPCDVVRMLRHDAVCQRLQPAFARYGRPCPPLGLVRQVNILQLYGFPARFDAFAKFVGQFALLPDRREDGLFACFEFGEFVQLLLDGPDLQFVERTGRLLAVAADKGDRRAVAQQAYRALHLPEGDSESLCYDLFGHCRCVSIGKDRKLS